MAVYAIGDVQGCHGALLALLEKIGFSASRDRLWFVGDLVNRGPHSLEVLRLVKGLGEAAVTVLGNHDLHLLMLAAGASSRNQADTLDAVLAAPDCDELLAWLRSQPLAHAEGEYLMVHAGVLPQWDGAKAVALAGEVHEALQARGYRKFLANMWGSTPTSWNDGLVGWDRLRVIVNAMTRMRFCSLDGSMEFRAKGPPDSAPPGCMPWFGVPDRASVDCTIVCGHWSALGYVQQPKLIALDSGCLWGGALTAVRLEDRQAFQLDCPPTVPPTR